MDYFDILLAKKLSGGGGGEIVLEDITITENGVVTAPSGKAYKKITTDVPLPSNAYLLKEVDGLPKDIATFTDGSNLPMPSLKVGIEPIQDLHGYDAPWVGGAGKNKLPMTVEGIKAVNTYHSWSGNSTTINNVTITIETSNSGDVTGIRFNGTASADITFNLASNITIPNGSYVWSNDQIVNISNLWLSLTSPNIAITLSNEKEKNVTVSNGSIGSAYIYASSGNVFNNIVFKPMIRLSTVSDGTFAPYSNICPISGWTEAEVSVCGKNLYPHNGISVYDYAFSQQIAFSQMRNPIFMKGGQKYVLSLSENITLFRMRAFDKFQNLVTDASIVNAHNQGSGTGLVFYANGNFFGYDGAGANSITAFQPTEDIWFDMTVQTTSPSQVMFEIGDTATTYEPYNGNTYTIPFLDSQGNPVEVFGGECDVVNGKVKPNIEYDSYNGETLVGRWISDRDVYAEGTTPTIGAQVVDLGAYGSDISVQPTSIKSIEGVNNVWADTGEIEELSYFSKPSEG